MRWLFRLYWGARSWFRPGVIMREPTRDEMMGWATFKKFPHAQNCRICGGTFWVIGQANVCGKRGCYVEHKMGRRYAGH